ncbi:hypothetical protein IMSAGC002_00584 [Lachnospiraceae bacterium]|nr:hypothetical protein IMSAGC002_00584 [Lachnospiraceae bacterium]
MFLRRFRDDIRTIDNSKMQLVDESRMKNYMDAVKAERKNLADNVSQEEILELMGITAEGVPTLAGLMTFSKYPQTYFPQLCITAVALPGTEMGTVGDGGERQAETHFAGKTKEFKTEICENIAIDKSVNSHKKMGGLEHL